VERLKLKCYCYVCSEYIEPEIDVEPVRVLVNELDTIDIMGEKAYCPEGHEIYVEEVEHRNLHKAKIAYEQLKPYR
jgi:hypothetical protein